MINIRFYRNGEGELFGFKVENHGDPIVCSAVSILTFNVLNSIETLTDEIFEYEVNEKKAALKLIIPKLRDCGENRSVSLLLNSLHLGITGIKEEYGGKINIIE